LEAVVQLPEDRELLAAMVRTLLWERNHEKHRAEELEQRAEAQAQRAQEQKQRAEAQARRDEAQAHRAEELQVELLRLQLELERFKKWYYLTQLLINLPAAQMSELSAWLPDQWKLRQPARAATL
jgi:hypothetical protein